MRTIDLSFSHRYWSTKTDGAHRHPNEECFLQYARELLAMLPRRGILLDVGCGSCQVTTYLAPEFDQVYAIDFSESMLEAARKRVVSSGLKNIELLPGTASAFPATVTHADVILTSAVVQYFSFADLACHLEECRRILNREGIILAALIPDSARKKTYYYGYFSGNRYRRLKKLRTWIYLSRLRAKAYLKSDLLWDGIGNWFDQTDIERAATEAGLRAEFRDSQTSDYRFHAILRRRRTLATVP